MSPNCGGTQFAVVKLPALDRVPVLFGGVFAASAEAEDVGDWVGAPTEDGAGTGEGAVCIAAGLPDTASGPVRAPPPGTASGAVGEWAGELTEDGLALPASLLPRLATAEASMLSMTSRLLRAAGNGPAGAASARFSRFSTVRRNDGVTAGAG